VTARRTVAVTGCGGMLGEAVHARFTEAGWRVVASDIDLNERWLHRVDVTDAGAVARHLEAVRPDAVVHLAAETDMERCQLHPVEAYDVNTSGVAHVLAGAAARGVPFVYISTAGIFDGRKRAYHEGDQPNPLSVYGKSKYAGELVARSYPRSIVLRAGWMMGGGPGKDKKFVAKIVRQLNAGARTLEVVADKLGTPCYTYDLARSIERLVRLRRYGIFHGACRGGASRLEVARRIVTGLGLDGTVAVRRVPSSHWQREYFAPRPPSEQLVNRTLARLDPSLTRDWRTCLDEYLARFAWLRPPRARGAR
jgi:dTDP-4-dehydrorhamnose reductase